MLMHAGRCAFYFDEKKESGMLEVCGALREILPDKGFDESTVVVDEVAIAASAEEKTLGWGESDLLGCDAVVALAVVSKGGTCISYDLQVKSRVARTLSKLN